MTYRFWIAALVALGLDQYTKHLVLLQESTATFHPWSAIAIPRVLWWTYVENTHGAFGMFGSNKFVLIGMALVVLAIFWFAFREAAGKSAFVQIAFGAIVGGAIGNIVDRINHNFVVDFIDLKWWPVFNVADSCITVGVTLLILTSLRREEPKKVASTEDPSTPARPTA